MKYNTALGDINLNDKDILQFSHGILGFETLTQWAIRDSGENGLSWLLSLQRPEIAFIIWHVQEYLENYVVKGFELTDKTKVYSILTMRHSPDSLNVTANLLAPVIIDTEKRNGIQYVMNEVEYSARTPLYVREGGAC